MLTRETFTGPWAGLPVAWTDDDRFRRGDVPGGRGPLLRGGRARRVHRREQPASSTRWSSTSSRP